MKFMRWIVLAVFGGATGLGAETATRPNILLMFADDLGRYASAYADPREPSPNDLITTPAFDRVAREGAVFRNAFVAAPSCTPSRGALYTGRYFFRNGSASQLHSPWQAGVADPFDQVNGLPNTLAAAGYHFGWSHKSHLRESLFGGKQNEYSRHGKRINDFSEHVSAAADPAAEKVAILDEVRANFRDFLTKREPGQPFFYSFNPTNTHRQWVRGSGKKLWGLDPGALQGKLPPVLPDDPLIREDFADYLGEAMAFDAACGVLLDELGRLGELDRTVVVISGDHGIPGLPRGKCNVHDFGARVLLAIRWPGRVAAGRDVQVPVSLIDLAPTFLAAAGVAPADPINGQDLLPALAAGAGDSKLRGWALIGREVHYPTARAGNLPYPVRALRTPEFLYIINFKPDRWPLGDPAAVTTEPVAPFAELARNTGLGIRDMDGSPSKAWLVEHCQDEGMAPFLDYAWNKRPAEELYDLAKDPHQMRNVAADPNYEEHRCRLRARLLAELEANADPRLDHDAFDRPPYLATERKANKANTAKAGRPGKKAR